MLGMFDTRGPGYPPKARYPSEFSAGSSGCSLALRAGRPQAIPRNSGKPRQKKNPARSTSRRTSSRNQSAPT